MAKKPTVTTVSSGFASNTQLNNNFTALRDAFDNTLSLDGSTPNAMQADLDLNGNDLLNAGVVNADSVVVDGINLNTQVANAAASASAAAASASAASQYTPAYFDNVADLLADTTSWPTGQILNTREEGFAYEVAASGASDHHVTTAGGEKLYVLAGPSGMDVKAFGAKGDGVTDDTNAIHAARDALPNGGTIYFPKGTYVAQTLLMNKNGLRLVGDGVNATTLKLKDAQNTTFVAFSGIDGGEFAHMTIDGNVANNNSMTDKGALQVANSKNVTLHDFHIKDYDCKGVTITSGVSGTVEQVHVSSFSVTNCNEQAVIVDATLGTARRVTVTNFTVYDHNHAGIAVNDGATDVAISNAVIDCNTAVFDAVSIRNAKRVTVTNVVGRRARNGLYLLYDTAPCEDIVVAGCVFDTNQQNGVLILSSRRVTLSGVVCRNNDQGGSGAVGFNIAKSATGGAPECSYISLSNCIAGDDQGSPTQDYGFAISAAPSKILLDACSAVGNALGETNIAGTVAVGECLILPGHGVDLRDALKWTVTSSHGNLIEFRRSGDTEARFAITQNGQIEWGTGAAVRDIALSRAGTNLLSTPDKFLAAGLGIGLSATGISVQAATPSGNTSHKLAIYDSANNLIGYIPIYAAPW